MGQKEETEDEVPDCPNCKAPMFFEGRGIEGSHYRCGGCPARCLDQDQGAFRDWFRKVEPKGKIWKYC